ncbi:MAG: hypothetical protein RL297_813 [Pseudomonadota bacterium]|jgi:hypothetical protein
MNPPQIIVLCDERQQHADKYSIIDLPRLNRFVRTPYCLLIRAKPMQTLVNIYGDKDSDIQDDCFPFKSSRMP